MSELCGKFTEACQRLGFKIKETDDETIVIRYQMHVIHICFNEKSPDDCQVIGVVAKNVPEDDRLQILEHCNNLNERLKHFKYYIMGSGVVASIEFRFHNNKELFSQLKFAVQSISLARNFFERNN